MNLYVFYELFTWSRSWRTNFTIGDCLFGAVKLIMLIMISKDIVTMVLDLYTRANYYGFKINSDLNYNER